MTEENIEVEISHYEKEVQRLKKKRLILDNEHKCNIESNRAQFKRNGNELKQLRLEIRELESRIKQAKQNEENAIQEALEERSIDMDIPKGIMGAQLLRHLESRVLEATSKNQSLSHKIELEERSLKEIKKARKEMKEECKCSDIPTEADCLQRIRELENHLQQSMKNIEESEYASNKYKSIIEELKKIQVANYLFLLDLKKKMKIQDEEDNTTVSTEEVITDVSQNELEWNKLRNQIDDFKITFGAKTAQDIESLLGAQKSIQDDLMDLRKRSSRRLHDLKEEKHELNSRVSYLRNADSIYPRKLDEVFLSKQRYKEQKNRKETAKAEEERVNSILTSAETALRNLQLMILPKGDPEALDSSSTSLMEVACMVEESMHNRFSSKSPVDMRKNKK